MAIPILTKTYNTDRIQIAVSTVYWLVNGVTFTLKDSLMTSSISQGFILNAHSGTNYTPPNYKTLVSHSFLD